MSYFLDTNCLIRWFIFEDLPQNTIDAISDSAMTCYCSAVSAYEILFKTRLGKLEHIETGLSSALASLSIDIIPVTFEDAAAAATLEWSNRDPWDRIIAVQARRHNATLVSSDQHFDDIKIPRLWS